jgi:hypothetical protein
MERELRSATMGEDGVREGGSWLVLAEVTRWEKQQPCATAVGRRK